MPRPPAKKKLAPTFPNLPVAKASNASTNSPPRRNPGRQASERVSDASDDSQGLVTTTNRFKRRKVGSDQDATMSGGLGDGDAKFEIRKKPVNTRQRPGVSKVVSKPKHAKVLEGLKKRREAALKAQNEEAQIASTAGGEMAVVSDEPVARAEEVVPQAGLVTVDTQPKPTGPLTLESPVLAIANFKRRPRQPSILRMVQQDSDNDDDDASLDDFNPEDESTPLNLSKSRSVVQPDSAPDSPSHTPSSPNPRKRKLASPELQVPRSSPPLPSTEGEAAVPLSPSSSADSQDLPEQPVLTQHLPSRSTTPQIPSSTMAPPQSSSPAHPAPATTTNKRAKTTASKPPTQRNQPSRQAPLTTTNQAPTSSPTTSPPSNPAPQKRPKATPKPKTISTASLQTHLPRRRRRLLPNEFDIPSSDSIEHDTSMLNASDDELTHLPPTKTKRKPNTAQKKSPTKKAAPTKKPTTKAAKETEKDKEQASKRTYTRRRIVSSDKENNNISTTPRAEDTGDSSLDTITAANDEGDRNTKSEKASTELLTLAKKFKEVDNWQMEFEEVTASSSSPVDAR